MTITKKEKKEKKKKPIKELRFIAQFKEFFPKKWKRKIRNKKARELVENILETRKKEAELQKRLHELQKKYHEPVTSINPPRSRTKTLRQTPQKKWGERKLVISNHR